MPGSAGKLIHIDERRSLPTVSEEILGFAGGLLCQVVHSIRKTAAAPAQDLFRGSLINI